LIILDLLLCYYLTQLKPKLKITFMKKIFNLSILAYLLTAVGQINAQSERIVNGSFASSASWTVGATAAGVVGDARFGQTTDLPAGSVGTTCLKLSQGGTGKPEVQVYQKVQLFANQMYKISAKIKCTGVSTRNRNVQIYVMRNAAPDKGTMFTDATVNNIDLLGVDRTKAASLFLEAWSFSNLLNTTVSLNGAMPVSTDGTNSEYFKPPLTATYVVLIKCGQWEGTSPFSVTISDLSLVTSTVAGLAVTGVKIPAVASLTEIGETSQLTAAFIPSGATNKNVTWSSSNPAVATISSTGLVTAVSNGNTMITVTTADGGKTASYPMNVTTGKFVKVWGDEFNGIGAPDETKWGYETGYIRNKELQYYTKNLSNCSMNGGQLDVTVIKEPTNGYEYSSGSIRTLGKLEKTYGKIEGRFKVPKVKGTWSCFWTLGVNEAEVNWPKCGEIDIFEHVDTNDEILLTPHWADLSGAHVDKFGIGKSGKPIIANVDQWHTYSIEWTPSKIRWFVDGTKHHELNITAGVNNTQAFHLPHHILINLPIGGTWPQAPDPSFTSATLSCDYVHVYDWVPDVPVTVSGLTVSPSTMSLVKGNPMQLKVKYIPSIASNQTVTWSSSNVAVATVNASGMVTPLSDGTCTITATSTDGSCSSSSAITVKDFTGINFVKNPGFELDSAAVQVPLNWPEYSTTLGKDSASVVFGDAHSGNYKGVVTGNGSFTVMTYQGINELPSGVYTLKGWFRSTGVLQKASMSIKNYAVPSPYTEVQFVNAMNTWTQKTINNINITTGQCEIGINFTGGANQTLEYDDIELTLNSPAAGVSTLNVNNISIYPSVVKDNKLNIHNEGSEDYTATVLNFNGQVLIENKFDAGNSILNTSTLKSGMYMIKVVSGSQIFTDKFVVK
jgi:beta-glucanase (GH16 family)